MLDRVPYKELEVNDAEDTKAESALLGLERAVRVLLEAAAECPDQPAELETRITLGVCVDGQPYTISIVASASGTDAVRPNLSPREQDIARLIAKGLPTKTIAVTLGLRPCTVSTYTKRIYLKLKVNSRAEMVAKLLSQYSLYLYPPRTVGNPN